jgi:hypothetical protein
VQIGEGESIGGPTLENELPFDGFCGGGLVVGDGGGDAAAEDPHRVLIGALHEIRSSVAIAIAICGGGEDDDAIAGARLGMPLRRELGLGREKARDELPDEPGDLLALHCRDLSSRSLSISPSRSLSLSPYLLLLIPLSFSVSLSLSL